MKKLKLALLIKLLFCTMIFSQVNLKLEIDALKQVDIDFSNLSKAKGMRIAFLEYAAENSVLLKPFMMPVVGYDNVKKFLEDGDDSGFTLTWSPLYGDVSASGELGYTYGIYEMLTKDETGKDVVRKGTYVSIWKKNSDGKWKFTLDTGNPGIEPKQ